MGGREREGAKGKAMVGIVGVRGGDVKRRLGSPCFGLDGCLGGGAREGRWREGEEEGRGEEEREEKRGRLYFFSPLSPSFSVSAPLASQGCALQKRCRYVSSGGRVGRREKCSKVEQEVCKTLLTRALIFTDLLCSLASVRRSGAGREAVLLTGLCVWGERRKVSGVRERTRRGGGGRWEMANATCAVSR